MNQWILRAEADKIQRFIFSSARLREVAGGSQRLTQFCAEEQQHAQAVGGNVLVADGGSFTLIFPKSEIALAFGDALAQRYYAATGATLTVAAPVAWDGDVSTFATQSKEAGRALARAKRAGRSPGVNNQSPYTAFCASCGVGLAHAHVTLYSGERGNYVCQACQAKAAAAQDQRGEFFGALRRALRTTADAGKLNESAAFPQMADDLLAWDPRGYVAYLIADGNSMGAVFGECQQPAQLAGLSTGLLEVVRRSLAVPTLKLLERVPTPAQRDQIPILPLILGGDDVFVLLPAPYALDFAQEFCQAYEQQMQTLLETLQISGHPTMAAAVVICKHNYPYLLAHRRGEELLEQAKRVAKIVALTQKLPYPQATVNFDVILGHQLAQNVTPGAYHNSLAPYWAATSVLPEKVGLPVQALLEARYALRQLPQRRLAQLRTLYDRQQLPTDQQVAQVGEWQAALTQLLSRVARDPERLAVLQAVMQQLGTDQYGYWYAVNRQPGLEFAAHGLPDLIHMWDFSWQLDRPRSVYLEQEN